MAKTQTPGTEIVVRSSTDLAEPGDVLAELERILVTNERVESIDDDPDKIAAEIVAAILAAENDEQLAAMMGGNAEGWRDLLEVPIQVEGFRWRPSDFELGASLYFVVFGTRLDTGDAIVLTTGSKNAMAQLVNKAKRGVLSGSVMKMHQAEKATARGFFPLWLVDLPQTQTPAS